MLSRLLLTAALTFGTLSMLSPARVNAAPTPIPGGANQLKGVTGGLSSRLFNGKMRIRHMQLRPATATEASPAAGQTAVAFVYLVSNGTSAARSGNFTASMVDSDGVALNALT
jgi:hypothetical protein